MSGGGETPEQTLVAVRVSNSETAPCYCGYIDGNTLYITMVGEDKIAFVSQSNGNIISGVDWQQSIDNTIFQSVKAVYSDVLYTDKYDSGLTVGSTVPNWENYTILNPA